MAEGDEVWNLPDGKLLAQCRVEAIRASGKGGQKRNKTSSAIRLTHQPTGITAQAFDSRSQRENKIHAIRALRHKLAIEAERRAIDPVTFQRPEWMGQYLEIGLHMSSKNPRYPDAVALVLDVLKACAWDVPRAAANLGVTTSALIRFLATEHALWAKVNGLRKELGMAPLTQR